MDENENSYEVYLERADYTKLKDAAKSSDGLRCGMRILVAGDQDVDRAWVSAQQLLEICEGLNRIPWHYHMPIADALRKLGWGVESKGTKQ